MTENNEQKASENAKKIFNTLETVLEKAGGKAWEGAKTFFDDPIESTKSIGSALKQAGTKALDFTVKTGTNLLTDPQKAMHTAMGLAERAFNAVPVVGGILSFFTGTAKDALTDKKFENIALQLDGLKDGLNSLANSVGEALDGLRGEMAEALEKMGAKHDQLEQFTKAFKSEQEKVNQKVQQQIKHLQEKIVEHDKKIKDHNEKIFAQQIKIEDVRGEFKDQIRTTNTNLENLRKEQQETQQDLEKYKHQIGEKTAQTEQAFEDLEADYTRRNKIIETQINDNEEQLADFQENLSNVEFQQKILTVEHQEFVETLEEQVSLTHEQKKRLDLVVEEIADIEEEFNQKITRLQKSQLDQDEKISGKWAREKENEKSALANF